MVKLSQNQKVRVCFQSFRDAFNDFKLLHPEFEDEMISLYEKRKLDRYLMFIKRNEDRIKEKEETNAKIRAEIEPILQAKKEQEKPRKRVVVVRRKAIGDNKNE